ncbi:MAG: hypothetical protein JNN00_00350 [Chitinophagaceae bacterium]|nr:hypothetical protein [Chitinophagaceae bacterium]
MKGMLSYTVMENESLPDVKKGIFFLFPSIYYLHFHFFIITGFTCYTAGGPTFLETM